MAIRPLIRAALAVLLVLTLKATPALAQSSIAGVVKDSSGGVLPGVTVEASSPALIEQSRTTITDGQGLYRVVDLRPGTYTVTFTLSGFNTVRRNGIQLPASFNLTLNIDLPIGALEETLTVTGETPVVDIQSTARQQVFSNDVLESLPTNRTPQAFVAFVPGVTGGLNVTAVQSRSLSLHGSRPGEMNILIDGMSERHGGSGGSSSVFYMNQGSIQEMSVELGAGNAEKQMGGIFINAIPKEGSNIFSGQVAVAYASEAFASENLTPELRERGLTAVNGLKKYWDVNPSFGGRLIRDRLWFYGAYRNTDVIRYVANNYYDKDPLDWVYTPDFSRPAMIEVPDLNYALRVTWQATPRNKFSASHEVNPHWMYQRRFAATVAPEATTYTPYLPNYFASATWKSPVNNKLLLEAAFASYAVDWNERLQKDPLVAPGTVSATESSTQKVFRAATSYGHNKQSPLTFRASASYVTGSHSFKAGFSNRIGGAAYDYQTIDHNQSYNVTLLNGRPTSLTLWADPITVINSLNADLGVFAQDQWTLGRATLNLGLRYDYINGSVPPQELPAGRFIGARSYPAVSNVPSWHDLSPRLGGAYDLFGNGKTALKVALSKYVEGGARIQNYNPVNLSINNANRNWTDTNNDFTPDCDFSNPDANGECGRLSNLNFGKLNPRITRFDEGVLTGYGNRGNNWETSALIEHELRPNVSVSAGYYRRWYNNQTVTDNVDVTPADFDPYCITAPNDARLPDGGGQSICGFYDVSVAKFGQVNDFVTFAETFGQQTEIYDGVDVSGNLRLPEGIAVSGGVSMGRTAYNTCFVVDSPQQLHDCDVTPPFQANIKLLGIYPLPWWDIQVSGTLQSVPGPEITASYVVRNADIAPSLGRNLSSGPNGTVTLPLVKPGTLYSDRVNQVDLRISKNIRLNGRNLQATVEILNLANSSDIQSLNTRFGPSWLQPTEILSARYFKLGFLYTF